MIILTLYSHPRLSVKGVYSGFDPTAKSLHIGNLVPILGLLVCGQNEKQPYSLVRIKLNYKSTAKFEFY